MRAAGLASDGMGLTEAGDGALRGLQPEPADVEGRVQN
jgi:hypothetical protein